MAKQTDAEALVQWNDYVNRRVPVVIYPAPENLAESGKIVVAPVENPSWWLGGFGSTASAKTFCKNNSLDFTEVAEMPRKPRKAKVAAQPAA